MRIFITVSLFLITCVSFFSSQAQNQVNDTIFSYEDFIGVVKNHHPMATQANLRFETGEAKLLKSRGGFDPKLAGTITQKYFDGKNYYSYINSHLKVPTWFGLSFQGGYDQNNGEFLNDESFVPDDGLWYAGVTLNLGNGLFIDERRAELRQAQIFLSSSEIEQRLMLNQLVFDASIAYWDWFKAYNKVQVYQEALSNAEFRFRGVKQSASFGDVASIDTLKALIQVQDRKLKLEQSTLDMLNKKAYLEIFLWQDGFIPLEMDSTIRPFLYDNVQFDFSLFLEPNNLDSLVQNHPEVIYAQNDLSIKEIDYRLKRENLKPVIELKYNALQSGGQDPFTDNYSLNNYNWGAKVSYPLFTRKQRGDVRIAEIKIRDQEAKIAQKNTSVEYKIRATFNTWRSTTLQLDIASGNLINYERLFDSELTLFNIGESSLFLVNTRDQDRIEAQVKLIDIQYTNRAALADYNYQIINF